MVTVISMGKTIPVERGRTAYQKCVFARVAGLEFPQTFHCVDEDGIEVDPNKVMNGGETLVVLPGDGLLWENPPELPPLVAALVDDEVDPNDDLDDLEDPEFDDYGDDEDDDCLFDDMSQAN